MMKKLLLLLLMLFTTSMFGQNLNQSIEVHGVSYISGYGDSYYEARNIEISNNSDAYILIDYIYTYNERTGEFFYIQNNINQIISPYTNFTTSILNNNYENKLLDNIWVIMIRYINLTDGITYIKTVKTVKGFISSDQLYQDIDETSEIHSTCMDKDTGNIYSIDGISLKNVPNHGIYIVNGKKHFAN